MWAIRVLAGPTAGQTFPLRPGLNIIGRHPTCQVVLSSSGVSKNHAQILITEDKAILEDLKSRNGTLVNGVRAHHQRLKPGDKIQLHEIILELLDIDEMALLNTPRNHSVLPIAQNTAQLNPYGSSLSTRLGAGLGAGLSTGQSAADLEGQNPRARYSAQGFQKIALDYVEDVALPGIYKLAELFDFKLLLMSFILALIFVVTCFSIIPMSRLTKENIQKESQRRALTIARNLASFNRKSVLNGNDISLSTRMAEVEPGVSEALIVSATKGIVLAPATKAGNHVDIPFVHDARKTQDERIELLSDTDIAASVPISSFNPDLGAPVAQAYAIVLYSIDSAAVDFERVLSLFIQTFLIASLVGLALYFLLIKLIQHPYRQLNRQMDQILKTGVGELRLSFRDDELQTLISNLNSAISRMDAQSNSPVQSEVSVREDEAQALVQMMGWPCLAVSALDERIIAANGPFYDLQSSRQALEKENLDALSDPALRESFKDLLAQFHHNPAMTLNHQMPSQGSETYEITAQRVQGRHETSYYLICVVIQGEQAA